jgi:dipeptidyl aminopeptidase/acylaminoacyl peptidase
VSTVSQLERNLTAWFADTATPGDPDLAEDILLETRHVRQRPRWSFLPLLPRPMEGTRVGDWRPVSSRRAVILVAILALLALMAGALWIGSGPRLPPPFGRAANGLVAYEKSGDIFVVDPQTGRREGLVLGPETDLYPRWSLDGTRLAFVRGLNSSQRLVVVDEGGSVRSVSTGEPLQEVDPDSIAWSPDGRSVLLTSTFSMRRVVFLIDVRTGAAQILPIPIVALEAHWRPSDGRELVFVGGDESSRAFFRYGIQDGRSTEIAGTRIDITQDGTFELRPIGWTPDGSRLAYHREWNGSRETHVVDVETGDEVVLDVAYGRIANDGSRIVGLRFEGENAQLCVVPVTGGRCEPIEGAPELLDATGWASAQWAPDDSWIRSRSSDNGPAVLLSPSGGAVEWPPWAAEGAESWQRRAP